MSAQEILDQFRRLPFEEQYDVARQIAGELETDLPPDRIAELEKRADRLRRNPKAGVPWEQVRAELKERLEKRRACRGK